MARLRVRSDRVDAQKKAQKDKKRSTKKKDTNDIYNQIKKEKEGMGSIV